MDTVRAAPFSCAPVVFFCAALAGLGGLDGI